MREIFIRIDSTGDGYITAIEIKNWVNDVHVASNTRHSTAELKLIDKNNDGEASWDEVKTAMAEAAGGQYDDHNLALLKKRVEVADRDGNGSLSPRELAYVLSPGTLLELAQLEAEDIMTSQDTNKDGRVSFDEFSAHEMEHTDAEKDELRQEFNTYDTNNDGSITKDEVVEAFGEPRPQMLEAAAADVLGSEDKMDIATFLKNWKKYSRTDLTDRGQLLMFPKEYPLNPPLPFENVENADYDMEFGDTMDSESDDEGVDENDHEEL